MKFLRVIKISRPRFWLYELGAYAVGVAAASQFFSPNDWSVIILFGVFFLIPANVFIYGINDIYDYETDKLNPKKGTYEALVKPTEQHHLWWWIIGLNLPFLITTIILNLNPVSWFWLVVFWFFAGFYSAPPIRAKAKPAMDSLFSGTHYVATAFFGYALITGLWPDLRIAIAALAWTTAMHVYSAVPDIKADTQAGLQTLAMILGPVKTIWLCIVMYTTAALLAFPAIGYYGLALLVPYLVLMVASLRSLPDDSALFNLYKKFPLLNTFIGMTLFFLAWLS